ncbi:MAG: sigma-70 family RNA polymerase sigma factor [Acidimicrobiia bacterium]|nr:sigma-70 family RNA polymerase sigma factor [Acidimicrobiia bacterium]
MDAAIYRQHKDALVRYAAVLAGPSNAEDIVSTVVARIYKSKRTLSDLDDPKPYLMKAVLNASIDQGRRQQDLPLVDRAIEAREARPDVLEAVMDLPIQQRAAVYWTYWIGLSSEEAAEQMGCRPATVRRYLHLARKRLEGVIEHV